MTLTSSQFEEFQRLGTLPKPEVEPTQQPPQRRSIFRNILNNIQNFRTRQPQLNISTYPRRRLTTEQIRENIKLTNLLSGSAWNDRNNRGRISLMGSDRIKQQEIYNQQMQEMRQQTQLHPPQPITRNMPQTNILNARNPYNRSGVVGL